MSDERASLTLEEANEVKEALVEARHLLELVSGPLLGSRGCGERHPVTLVGYQLQRAEALMGVAMRQAVGLPTKGKAKR